MVKKTWTILISIILISTFLSLSSAHAQGNTDIYLVCRQDCPRLSSVLGKNFIGYFYFEIGGFSEGKTAIVINGDTRELTLVWAQSFPENMTQKKFETFIKEEKANIKVKKTIIAKEKFQAFEEDLLKCKLNTWKSKYINKQIMDGSEWKLQILFENGTNLSTSGINKFPKQWNQFKKAVEELKLNLNK